MHHESPSVTADSIAPLDVTQPWIAAAGVVLIASSFDIDFGVTVGLVVAVALMPLWWRHARTYRGFTLIAALVAISALSSVWLTASRAGDHEWSPAWSVDVVAGLLTIAAGTGYILWTRRWLQPWLVGALFGVGMLLAIRPGEGMFAENPWRFGFSVPVTVLTLALASRAKHRWPEMLVLVGLAVLSAVNGGRSSSAIMILVLLLVLWQARRPTGRSWFATLRTAAFLAATAATTYFIGQAAILEGLLGEGARERTELQITYSGSLITGGRPEIGAFSALLFRFPFGFGGGTAPAAGEIHVAKEGMAALNYDPNNGYVERFMFGNGFELHSLAGDLWAWCGLPGLLLAVTLAVLLVLHLVRRLNSRTLSALLTFLVVKSLWNIFFSPFASSLTVLVIALGLLLVVRESATHKEA
ncbi:hypothetical protein GCM10009809_29650 [Isoptericola hypogeus]|uniref:O-antigen ligase n=1 Tax=Isoptericola hypogeus TaxID=300179 RepID=A0ABP4VRK6_9MICO